MAYRSHSSTSGNSSSPTGSAPSGVQATDYLVACLSYSIGSRRPITPPSGWSAYVPSGNNDINCTAYYTAAGSVSDFVWSFTGGSDDFILHIVAFSGRAGTISGLASYTNSGTVCTAPGSTAAAGDDAVLFFASRNYDSSGFAANPSPATSVRQNSGNTPVYPTLLTATKDSLSAGATGDYTITDASIDFLDRQGALLLLPASGGGGGSLNMFGQACL